MMDTFHSRDTLQTPSGAYTIYNLKRFASDQSLDLSRLPYSLRILLENLLRKCDGVLVQPQDVLNIAHWNATDAARPAVPFFPGRVLLQDFTGVPVIVDLAAMRAALARMGGDPARINPVIPVDLVIDHSIQVDFSAQADALQRNVAMEYQRNRERYEFLHWGQQTFKNFRIVPPSTGIIHQVNLEYLAGVVLTRTEDGLLLAFPDSVVGSDSHTTMINGLGVLGWGLGGIEATAAMLGQPLELVLPDVIGVRLQGSLHQGVTPTDLTLTITQLLRKKGVVNKFVEFYGPGVAELSLADRAMVANMAPEYGATLAYFPVDEQTLTYLRLTSRPAEQIELVRSYFNAQGLFRTETSPEPEYSSTLEVDLSAIEVSLAGPRRPQDRVSLSEMSRTFRRYLTAPKKETGLELDEQTAGQKVTTSIGGQQVEMGNGAVVIAAITSCTNTSNPFVMITAGLLAKKAIERGLQVKPYTKTSLAPGSRVVTQYLQQAGLLEPLANLGFQIVGYGCTTCIGNSGPLAEEVAQTIRDHQLIAAAVLSGNRNFEGRIHPLCTANYLASPPLVVAFALAGTVDIDLERDPLGRDSSGQPVYLRDLWPSTAEVQQVITATITPELYRRNYADIFAGDSAWQAVSSAPSALYTWQTDSTYIQEPPYFANLEAGTGIRAPQRPMRVLAVLGDSVTTDHISPAGDIPANSAAGKYLQSLGIAPADFNSYGARRGNYQVLERGTFANIRLKNQLTPQAEGSVTLHLPDGEPMSIFAAAQKYQAEGVPLIVLAGREYGTGSSRDWAAKGPLLLGVRAVIAESFERIHRSNLVGMGVLPLQFLPGEGVHSLGLSGRETFAIEGWENMQPNGRLNVLATAEDGRQHSFMVVVRIATSGELEAFQRGGILHAYILHLLKK